MDENWNKAMFEKHLNTSFQVSERDGRAIEATLVEVEHKENGPVERVSVLFQGPRDPVLNHDTLTVAHPEFGTHEIFMGPVVHPTEDGVYYEAIFNRLKEKP